MKKQTGNGKSVAGVGCRVAGACTAVNLFYGRVSRFVTGMLLATGMLAGTAWGGNANIHTPVGVKVVDRIESGEFFRYFVFTNAGTTALNVLSTGKVDVLVVAGGGGSGWRNAGGGGAGGVVCATNYYFQSTGTKYVTVGGGGASATTGTSGGNGTNSVFDTNGTVAVTQIIAVGGGGGGAPGTVGVRGGSGGGGGDNYMAGGGSSNAMPSAPANWPWYGNSGGKGGIQGSSYYVGGGGGGAGSVGATGTTTVAGNGGTGVYFQVFTNLIPSRTGEDGWFAGGGAGGDVSGPGTETGGLGGGGNEASAGLANTGGGGGGWTGGSYPGGSGVVIVRCYCPGAPVIENKPNSTFNANSATLSGYLVTNGSSPASIYVLWGTTDYVPAWRR